MRTTEKQNVPKNISVGTKMKTQQIMERNFYGGIVRQNHKTGWLNATDLLEIGNDYRLSVGLPKARLPKFLGTNQTKAFIEQILDEEKITSVVKATRGKGGSTWMHPLLFVDFAMYINPKFKYEAMKWLTDMLLVERDMSGESFKQMTGAIKDNYELKGKLGLVLPKIASRIKRKVGVDNWNEASETELRERDDIHKRIIFGANLGASLDKVVEEALK